MTILEGLIKSAPDEVVIFMHDECNKSINDINRQIQELSKERGNWERRADVTSKEIKKRSIGFAAVVDIYESEPEPEEAIGSLKPAPGWVPERTTRQLEGGEYDIS